MSEIQISINNLSKVYDNSFKALDDVSLKVKKGEIERLKKFRDSQSKK